MEKTANGLVEWARSYVNQAYWYGTFCTMCTESLYEAKKRQYPSHYTAERQARYRSDIAAGKKCADCVGLVKGYMWFDGSDIRYDGKTDFSADGMYQAATVKGAIGTMPEEPGIIVWKEGHMGVYAGGGRVIEARGFAYGVVETALKERGFKAWYQCPYVQYGGTGADGDKGAGEETAPQPPAESHPTIRKGDKGESVKLAQTLLQSCGYSLPKYGVDGNFGDETLRAVMAFQQDNALAADGIIGPNTWNALKSGKRPEAFTVKRLLKKMSPMMRGEDVKWLQQRLTAQGYPCGAIDSIFGDRTEAAVRACQKASGLAVDGMAGKNTVTALGGHWAG